MTLHPIKVKLFQVIKPWNLGTNEKCYYSSKSWFYSTYSWFYYILFGLFYSNRNIWWKYSVPLSKSSLKKAHTLLDLKEHIVRTFKQDVKIFLSSRGHYAAKILPHQVYNFDTIEHVLISVYDDEDEKKHIKLIKFY